MLTIERPALESLAALLLERAGLKVPPEGYYGLRLALSARMPALGMSDAGEYVSRLRELAGEHELRSLLPLVTVGHTEFFRDARQFHALEKRILPDLLKLARREMRKIRIWTAGCATGEEPYSLAMVMTELGAHAGDVEILATDLNLAAVEQAKLGRFSRRRVLAMSGGRVERFFEPDGDFYRVKPELKTLVHFEGHNLAAPLFQRASEGGLDLILCRNVIIYFDLATIRSLMGRFVDVLRPTGFLLLGYSESLFKVYDRFEMVEVEGAFIYQRGSPATAGVRAPPAPLPTPAASRRPASVSLPPGVPAGTLPAAKPSLAPSTAPPLKHRLPTDRLDDAVALMNRGQFEGALKATAELCAEEPNDLDALLTLANLHALMGHPTEAQRCFTLALTREPLCVEARIFGGVAALQTKRFAEARSEFGRALFLEPTLAIGHYLLAQTHEQMGDREAARRAYRNAIVQLKFPQRPLAGHYPDMIESADAMGRAAKYALAALEEV